MEQLHWRRLDGTIIKGPIEDEVRAVLVREKEMGHTLKVCIGTDSQVKGKETEFATVIVFIRKGKGGFMYIHNEITQQKMSIKQRMLMEVSKSIEVAYALCRLFTIYNVDMEVHADINTNPNFNIRITGTGFLDTGSTIHGIGCCRKTGHYTIAQFF